MNEEIRNEVRQHLDTAIQVVHELIDIMDDYNTDIQVSIQARTVEVRLFLPDRYEKPLNALVQVADKHNVPVTFDPDTTTGLLFYTSLKDEMEQTLRPKTERTEQHEHEHSHA